MNPSLTEENLKSLFIKQRKKLVDVAKECNATVAEVIAALESFNLPTKRSPFG